jgi:hypothetical protein
MDRIENITISFKKKGTKRGKREKRREEREKRRRSGRI